MKLIFHVALGLALVATTPLLATADSDRGYTVTMPHYSDDPNGVESQNVLLQLTDGIVVRPIGMVLSTITSVLYIGTTPLTFLMDVDEQAADALVVAPWRLTVGRPLGYFGG